MSLGLVRDHQTVVRKSGEDQDSQCCISPRTRFNGGSIWDGISLDARTDLVFAPFIGENFLSMDDNARPHRARIVDQYLEQVGVQRRPWLACSPDLNPIEHVWDFLSRRVRRRQPRPETLNDLRVALEEEWAQITQDYLATLIQSMPNRLREVIRARGGNTRY
jgi:hypothetical protein